MSIPVFKSDLLDSALLREALLSIGCFQISHPLLPATRCDRALQDAQHFFNLPPEVKAELDVIQSQHFRGYSEVKNDRDWREQIHFGVDAISTGSKPSYRQLEGPNRWPPDPAWRQRMTEYVNNVASIGETVLAAVAISLNLTANHFQPLLEDPYLLMKLICYHPQPSSRATRSGVAPHVDFSWITLTLQDETGGLHVRKPDGAWIVVPPTPGVLLVHLGELMQFATRSVYVATPHRVINPSSERARVSIPIFMNPSLRTIVEPFNVSSSPSSKTASLEGEHVHRFLRFDGSPTLLHFGEAEWQRKGLNMWCVECCEKQLVIGSTD